VTLYPSQDTFVRGELSPRLHARASLELYRAGLSRCENFLTLPHGGLRKRGGTYYVDETISSSEARPIPFVFSADQAYCLILTNLKLRVYAYGARVGTVEVVTPWPTAALGDLKFTQSADVMWIVHPDYAPRKLTRTAHESWSLSTVTFTDGPFEAVNSTEADTMYVSAATGAITVHSSANVFTAASVGQLIRIDMESYEDIAPWEPVREIAASGDDPTGEVVRYNGNVYVNAGPDPGDEAFTGATPPTHLKGTELDGPNKPDQTVLPPEVVHLGQAWTYLHSGYGVARITGFTSATEAAATVVSRFPDEVVGSGNASYLWRFGAFGGEDYPDTVALFEERLVYGLRFSVYGSKTSDFTSFRLGEKDDDALQFLQAGGGQASDIKWLSESEGFLVMGTVGGIRSLSGSGLDEALTPSSFKNRKSRTFGSSAIPPVDTGVSFIYATRGESGLAELQLNTQGKFTADDLGQISEHIPKRGVVALAFQEYPDPFLWFPLETGELGCMTFQPAQEVRGMHRHKIGGAFGDDDWGFVEDVVVTPGQTGEDDVWLIVKRTIGGVTKRYIEIITPSFEYQLPRDAFQVDCGLSRTGSAVNTVTGLSHLNGETVDVLAGAIVYKGLTVSGGEVSLPGGVTAATWHVGLPFTSEADTLELDVGGKDGSLMGRRKRVHEVILSLFETDLTGLEISSLLKGRWEQAKLPTIVPAGDLVTLYTGNVKVRVDDSWEGQGQISIRHRSPTPCTIRAMTPVFSNEP